MLSGTSVIENRILGGLDEFFSRTDSTGAYSPIADAQGGVLALTNSSGETTTQYGYDPYGNTTSYGSTSPNVFQYTARENDENGLYYYRARYYSPGFGRFVSEDPSGFRGGINKYAYVNDSPSNLADPNGLNPGTLQVGAGGTFSTPPFAVTGGAGVTFDDFGDVGTYEYAGGGAGAGSSGLSGGAQVSISNAETIGDIAGNFNNVSVGGGDVVGGSFDGYSGTDAAGNQVVGGGGTVGGAAGVSWFGGRSKTWVQPLFNWIQWLAGRQCPNGAPPGMYQPAGGGFYYVPEPGEPGNPWN